jgi:uncharacterized protein (DUF302 family)
MDQKDFAYIVKTNKSFDDAVISVLKSIEQKNWGLFSVLDIKERLAAKGFNQRNIKIIELCSAKDANKMLNADMLVSIFMPCRIVIFEEKDGSINIASMKPSAISQFFPEISATDAQDLEKRFIEIIDTAK